MLELTLRITFSLLIVVGLMWGLAKLVRRPLAGRSGGSMSVVSRQQLTKGSSLALVRVVDRVLVLGVTDGHVTMLTEVDAEALERQTATANEQREAVPVDATAKPAPADRLTGSVLSPQTWRGAMNFLRDRTARS
jgi:flagellar protein FliO/FliZ